MGLIENIEKLYTYRDNIADTIRIKGIDVPNGVKLKDIPQYIKMLINPDQKEYHPVWEQEFQDSCMAVSLANYLEERSKWTGHVDRVGLREIGWTEDDIDYFQQNGVDWMAEDDDKYLVSDYEKEIYKTNAIKTDGTTPTYTNTLLMDNDSKIIEWRNNIKWMPKFQTTTLPQAISFRNFIKMIGCPSFDFSNTTDPSFLFSRCFELRCIPPITFSTTSTWNGHSLFFVCSKIKTIPDTINWENCSNLEYAFGDCTEALYIPEINVPIVENIDNIFTNCQKLIGVSIKTSNALNTCSNAFTDCRSLLTAPFFNTSNCTKMNNMFSNCTSLYNVPLYDTSKNVTFSSFFRNCSSLLTCPEFNFNGGVTTYNSMFMGCENLKAIPNSMNFDVCTDVASMCYRCSKITEFQHKLNLNSSANSAAQGIKNFSNCLYGCTSLKKLNIGLYYAKSTDFLDLCTDIEEINIDDFSNRRSFLPSSGTNLLTSGDLFSVTKIGGELKGMKTSFDMSRMRKLPKESLIYVFEKLEKLNGRTRTLTIGSEAMRNLTLEEKAIVTDKGWILA